MEWTSKIGMFSRFYRNFASINRTSLILPTFQRRYTYFAREVYLLQPMKYISFKKAGS